MAVPVVERAAEEAISSAATRVLVFLAEHDLFGKPESTPDRIRGRLFPML
jgi:hypothetical protein